MKDLHVSWEEYRRLIETLALMSMTAAGSLILCFA